MSETLPLTVHDILTHNRVILTHFDSYSTALLFPRWGNNTLLWPQALPESASPMAEPITIGPEHVAHTVKQAVALQCSFNPDELEHVGDFRHWARTEAGPVRVHLLRFTTLDAPKEAVEALGGVFKPISLLRGSAMSELLLLREVFNLIVGGGAA